MPKTITNEDGTTEEVYTQDELDQIADQKAQEAREALEQEKQTEIEQLNEKYAADQEELEKLRNKDMNFENLRKKNNKPATNAAGETAEDIEKRLAETNARIDEIHNQRQSDTLNDFIKDKIGEDKDKKEKFDYYYKKLGSEAKTKEEIQKAAQEALTLAGGSDYKGDRDQSLHSTQTDLNYRDQGDGVTQQSRSMGDKLGVSEEDRKKYGNKKRNI